MSASNARALLGAETTVRYRVTRSIIHAIRRANFAAEDIYRRRTGRMATVAVGEYTMSVPNDMRWAFVGGTYYERTLADWLPLLLQSAANPVFYDIGANAGYYTLLMASHGATVHAFEPVTTTRAILQHNIARNCINGAKVHKIGLSDSSGTATIRLYSSSGNNSLFDLTLGRTVILEGTEEIALHRLDDIVSAGEVSVPGLVKMDVEGAEMLVLRGGAETFGTYRPTIVTEFNDDHFSKAGYSSLEMTRTLTEMGYVLYGIADDARAKDQIVPLLGGQAKTGYGNVIAITPERAATTRGLPVHNS